MPRTWTEEEKEEQRERMLQLHAEGRAGAEFGKLGGRPRKKRPQERMAQRAEGDGDRLYDRLVAIADQGRDGDSIRAIQEILAVVENERKIEEREEERIDELNRTQLLEVVRTQMAELIRRGDVGRPTSRVSQPVIERGTSRNGQGDEVTLEIESGAGATD